MAPTIVPRIPKPRKSPRVIGSFCSSANLYAPSKNSSKLPAETARWLLGLHRKVRLIIYRVRHLEFDFMKPC